MLRRSFLLFSILLLTLSPAAAEKVSPNDAKAIVEAGGLLVDVRSPKEFRQGHVEGALNIPYDDVAKRLKEFGPDKTRAVVLYCGSGRRAGIAEETLRNAGFKDVYNAGGYKDWPKSD